MRTHTHTPHHTQWCYQCITKAPMAIRGSEIGNRYFQQLPHVSGDLEPRQFPRRVKKWKPKLAEFPPTVSGERSWRLSGLRLSLMTAPLSSDLESQRPYLSALWLFVAGRTARHGGFVIKLPKVFGENADKVRLSVRLQRRKHFFTSHPCRRLCEEENRLWCGPAAWLVAHRLASSAQAAVAAHKFWCAWHSK